MTLFARCRMALLALAAFSTQAVWAQSLSFRDILQRTPLPQPTHKFAYGAGPQQYGELWLPQQPGPHPVVVLLHGGCWLVNLPGPELVAFLADALRKEGLAVWSLTYRRVGHDGGGYPGTFLDIANGFDHLRSLASTHQLNLQRVVATGHSAGGHLALWAAARGKLPQASALATSNPLRIQRVVTIAGINDLADGAVASAHACGTKTVSQLVDAEARGKMAFADTSPAELLPLGVPLTLVSGVSDRIVVPAQAQRYQQRAARAGEQVTLETLDGAGHFELIAPWTAPGRRVVNAIVEAARALK